MAAILVRRFDLVRDVLLRLWVQYFAGSAACALCGCRGWLIACSPEIGSLCCGCLRYEPLYFDRDAAESVVCNVQESQSLQQAQLLGQALEQVRLQKQFFESGRQHANKSRDQSQ